MTTTVPSSDGHVHSLSDLYDAAEVVNAQVSAGSPPPLSVAHREDQGFVGHITRCWVEELEDHAGHHALCFEGEIEDGVETSVLNAISIAFFKEGFSMGDGPKVGLRIGLPRGFLTAEERRSLALAFQDSSRAPKLEVRDYYEHAVAETIGGIIIFVITDPRVQDFLAEAAGKVAETIVEAIFRHRDEPIKAIKIESKANGDLYLYVPIEADKAVAKAAITEAFRTIRNRDDRE
jgi:hypothetical protein